MNHRRAQSRGFVLLVALAIFAVVAVAIAALASAASADGQRTVQQIRLAQIDQMLLAGTIDAAARLRAGPLNENQSWAVDLPESLRQRDGSLHIDVASISSDGHLELHIRATLDRRSVEQTVRYVRRNDAWRLVSAEPDGG